MTTWCVERIHIPIRSMISHFRSLQEKSYPGYLKLFHLMFPLFPSGEPIFESDWDVLIVLDACRLDLMDEVQGEYSFIPRVDSRRSVDSMTRPWMTKNFATKYRSQTENTCYICGSPFSQIVLDQDDFLELEEIWKHCWDDELGTIPARPVTDWAISNHREHSPDRMIVHYLQPHHPFVPDPDLDPGQSIDYFNEEPWDDIWTRLQRGEVTKGRVWNAYRDNLRYVLDDVEILLNNIDADNVVITSDHGNAFGEWGIYGHPMHIPLRCLRIVPWIETSAVDTGNRNPKRHLNHADSGLEDRLTALGYHESAAVR